MVVSVLIYVHNKMTFLTPSHPVARVHFVNPFPTRTYNKFFYLPFTKYDELLLNVIYDIYVTAGY